MEGEIELIAHRGGRGFGIDNTLEAMVEAVRKGVRFIETDVRCTLDGELVLCHDGIIWGRSIKRITLGELWKIAPERPLLVSVLDELAGWVRFDLEIKDAPGELVAELLDIYNLESTALISSFKLSFLKTLRRTCPGVRMGYLYRTHYGEDKKLRNASETGAYAVMPHFHSVSPGLIRKAHALGLKVIAWTVNEENDLRRLVEWGIDGIVTDRYLTFKDLLRRRRADLPGGSTESFAG